MSQPSTYYKIRFLVSTNSWDQVKKVFKNDLGVTKDKKDDSVVPIRDHFVVELELASTDLIDEFYEKVKASRHLTILSDERSQADAKEVLLSIASVELKLRELAVYAYDLATTYKDIMNTKHKDAKQLVSQTQLVGEKVTDPLVSYLDFGELIDFLGRTGNQVDESNLADDTARLIESSASFDDFKNKYTKKFKKLSVWEIISRAVLISDIEWEVIKKDLDSLKDIRNTALHYRVLKPARVAEAKSIATKLMRHFKTKEPKRANVENLDAVFESWNRALAGYSSHQKALEQALAIDTSGFQKIISQQFDTRKTFQQAIENMTKMPDIQTSAIESLRRSLNSVDRLGLSAWVVQDKDDEDKPTSQEKNDKNIKESGDSKKEDENDQRDKKK